MANSKPIPRFIDECFKYVYDRFGGEVMVRQKSVVLVFESATNRYQHFRPQSDRLPVQMYREEEYDNVYDKNAIQVRICSEVFFLELDRERERKDG